MTEVTQSASITDDDLRYLVKLADWMAGQGFCQIEGLEDPDEWCLRVWGDFGPELGDGYTPDALADVVIEARGHARSDAERDALVAEVAEARMVEVSLSAGIDLLNDELTHLLAEVARKDAALIIAYETFTHYAALHRAKGPDGLAKACVNDAFAADMNRALAPVAELPGDGG